MKKLTLFTMLVLMLTLVASENEQEIPIEQTEFQTIEMTVDRHGWTPNSFTLKKGVPVKWKINAKELTYCNESIVVPEFDLKIELQKGEQVVEFTPKENGEVKWSCWMDMIPGSFIVTDDGKASETESKEPQSKVKSCCGSK